MKTISEKVRVALEAFLSTWAVIRLSGLQSTNVLTVFAYAFLFYMFGRIRERKSIESETRTQKSVEIGLSLLFTFLYICGDFEHIYQGLDNYLFRGIVLFVSFAGLYLLLEKSISVLIICTKDWYAYSKKQENTKYSVYQPILIAIFCLLCWIPHLLKNFPGVMTIDSMNQFAQVLGIYADSNHHPWVHTQIIKFFYQLGLRVTGDMTNALCFYTIFQMLFMAFTIGYLVAVLRTYQINKWALLFLSGFYALVPYNGIYAVTIWKDSMFAGAVLLYIATFLALLKEQENQEKIKSKFYGFMLFLSGIMMCLFRTNGWYAFLITIPFCIYTFRKEWKRMGLLQLAIVVIVLFIKGPVMKMNDVIQPDLVESLSIPIQQISRVIVMDRDITKEQSDFLNEILEVSEIKTLYNPYVSDGFKRLVRAGNQEYLENHFGEFCKIYLQIGIAHPIDYIVAFRDQSIGYWFPLQEGIIAGDEGVIPNEFGVENRAVLKGPVVIKIHEIALKLKDMLPGYGILWCMGGIFWLILLAAGVVMIRGDKRMLLLYVPCIAIVLTLIIATPVAKEFRYAYGYVFSSPLYLLIPFLEKCKTGK